MKTYLFTLFLFTLFACSGNGGAPNIDGTWIYSNGDVGQGLTINADGTYELQWLTLLSSTSGEDEVQTGTIEVGDSTLTFTPQKWSCAAPYPAFTWNYAFDGALLEIDTGSTVVSYSADTAAASSFQLALGCYDQNGDFTSGTLAPIQQ